MQTLSPPYLRVLGMNERGKQILSAMKKTASLPVSTSLMKLARSTEAAHQWAQVEAAACDQYSIFSSPFSICCECLIVNFCDHCKAVRLQNRFRYHN